MSIVDLLTCLDCGGWSCDEDCPSARERDHASLDEQPDAPCCPNPAYAAATLCGCWN